MAEKTTKVAPRAVNKAGMAHGRDLARKVIAARKKKAGKPGMKAPGDLVIAEGDSWFDYPFVDVLERLEDKFNYRVESVAHKGDTIESIAYDASQVEKLAKLFDKLAAQAAKPRAILLSGGGNDIAGDEFAVLLNHKLSTLPALNEQVVNGILDERLRFAIVSVLSSLTALSEQYFKRRIPILVHGYGNAVPDGRGYLGGAWVLPGPWLRPGFVAKGYDDLTFCAGVVADLIKRFNLLLQSITTDPGFKHVTYLDVRGVLSSTLPGKAYKKDWNDELHPTQSGFQAVANEFNKVIQGLPPAVAAKAKAPKASTATRRKK
jgi:lysophospholipase L1-like esterase